MAEVTGTITVTVAPGVGFVAGTLGVTVTAAPDPSTVTGKLTVSVAPVATATSGTLTVAVGQSHLWVRQGSTAVPVRYAQRAGDTAVLY